MQNNMLSYPQQYIGENNHGKMSEEGPRIICRKNA